MTYPNTVGGPAPYPQQGQAPWTPPPAQPSPQPPRSGTWGRLGLAAAVLAAAVGGGIVGSLLTDRADTSAPPDTSPTTAAQGAATPEDVHAQDIKLCTDYVMINSAMPNPDISGQDLLAGVAALENALERSPGASPEVRDAMNAVVQSFYAKISAYRNLRPEGLSVPPGYDNETVQASYDRAWTVCGLNR